MIKPTVGRIVWYWPGDAEKSLMAVNGLAPLAAIVTAVFDMTVNLVVFDAKNAAFGIGGVLLYQGDGPRPYGNFCEWMPYQIGQAAKAEALEHDLAEASKDFNLTTARNADLSL